MHLSARFYSRSGLPAVISPIENSPVANPGLRYTHL
jgi:hypothetical protein